MDTTSILFSGETHVLGEVLTRGGKLFRVMLTEEGEKEIGDTVALWQTQGVPFRRAHETMAYQEHISVRDELFLEAIRQWASIMRLHLLTLEPDIFVCWQQMTSLPLEPVQRYSLLLALKSLGVEKLAEWKRALAEAEKNVHIEQEKTTEEIRAMWAKMALRAVKESKVGT